MDFFMIAMEWLNDKMFGVIDSTISTLLLVLFIFLGNVWRRVAGARRRRHVAQVNRLIELEGGKWVLSFRDIESFSNIADLGLDIIHSLEWRRLITKTSVSNPLVPFSEKEGRTLQNIVFQFTRAINPGVNKGERWYAAVTCESNRIPLGAFFAEEQQGSRRVVAWIVRVFGSIAFLIGFRAKVGFQFQPQARTLLIEEKDLERFLSAEFCREILVEEPYHAQRVVTFHQMALRWQAENKKWQSARRNGGNEELRLVVPMHISAPEVAPIYPDELLVSPDWSGDERLQQLIRAADVEF